MDPIVLLMPKAPKLINGKNLTVLTSHDVSGILNSQIQSDNDYIFKAAVSQGVSKAQGIEYHYTVPGDPNLQKTLQRLVTLKRHLCRITQETWDIWLKVLPIPLTRAWTAPKKKDLSLWQTGLCTDIVIDPEALKLTMWLSFQLFNLLINWKLPMVGFSTSRKRLSLTLLDLMTSNNSKKDWYNILYLNCGHNVTFNFDLCFNLV